MNDEVAVGRPVALPIALVVGGGLLWFASSAVADDFSNINDPTAPSPFFGNDLWQCTTTVHADQAAAFGVSNGMVGMIAAALLVAAGLLAFSPARHLRAFWSTLSIGTLMGAGFAVWLMCQSLYALGALCPPCMLVWAVCIPLGLATTLYSLAFGGIPAPPRVRVLSRRLYFWVPSLSLSCYLVIAVMIQVRLNATYYF